jgi:translation initiation factor 2 subunit 1
MAPTRLPTQRFYENEFPVVGEIVLAYTTNIGEMGVTVQLPEYGNIEGMILLSELSRKQPTNKKIKVKPTEYLKVLAVDPVRRYIDLSKRRVTSDDAIHCGTRYNRSKLVDCIFRFTATETDITLATLYQEVGWILTARHGHAFNAFHQYRASIMTADELFMGLDVNDNVKATLLRIIDDYILLHGPHITETDGDAADAAPDAITT